MAQFSFGYYGEPGGSRPAQQVPNNMDAISINDMLRATVLAADDVHIELRSANQYMYIGGTGLTYGAQGQLIGGVIDRFQIVTGDSSANLAFFKIPATQAWDWLVRGATSEALRTIYAGDDRFTGSEIGDLMRGYAGNDLMEGLPGADSLFGGAGNDTLQAGTDLTGLRWSEFLRGEEGADSIVGGNGFDDIHGNQGADTATGGMGNDWVVGGQHNDLLFGGRDNDIVYGNMGDDTLFGDREPDVFGDFTGADTLRGGQGDDSISGENGADLIWGDRGNDTISGGAGADTFAIFAGGGIDKILDFNAAQGDRVVVEFGSPYTVRQVGGDAVVDLGGGDQMILVGVNASSLPAGWIG